MAAASGCCHEGASIYRFPGWVVPDCTGLPGKLAGVGRPGLNRSLGRVPSSGGSAIARNLGALLGHRFQPGALLAKG